MSYHGSLRIDPPQLIIQLSVSFCHPERREQNRETGDDRPLPYTGKEYLASLDDGREVWIYGERVKNIAEHPAFRNSARMVARLYDALRRDHAEATGILSCPTEWGGFTHRYFVARARPRS